MEKVCLWQWKQVISKAEERNNNMDVIKITHLQSDRIRTDWLQRLSLAKHKKTPKTKWYPPRQGQWKTSRQQRLSPAVLRISWNRDEAVRKRITSPTKEVTTPQPPPQKPLNSSNTLSAVWKGWKKWVTSVMLAFAVTHPCSLQLPVTCSAFLNEDIYVQINSSNNNNRGRQQTAVITLGNKTRGVCVSKSFPIQESLIGGKGKCSIIWVHQQQTLCHLYLWAGG